MFRPVQVTADGSQVPMPYRWKLVPDAKVNSFKPKDLSGGDKLALRAGEFGAIFNGQQHRIPRAVHADLVWEAS